MFILICCPLYLQPRILPKPKEFEDKTDLFWEAMTKILGIREQSKLIRNLSESDQPQYETELSALVVLLEAFENATCTWVKDITVFHSSIRFSSFDITALILPVFSFCPIYIVDGVDECYC